jgi:hypothetical protein
MNAICKRVVIAFVPPVGAARKEKGARRSDES